MDPNCSLGNTLLFSGILVLPDFQSLNSCSLLLWQRVSPLFPTPPHPLPLCHYFIQLMTVCMLKFSNTFAHNCFYYHILPHELNFLFPEVCLYVYLEECVHGNSLTLCVKIPVFNPHSCIIIRWQLFCLVTLKIQFHFLLTALSIPIIQLQSACHSLVGNLSIFFTVLKMSLLLVLCSLTAVWIEIDLVLFFHIFYLFTFYFFYFKASFLGFFFSCF